MSGPVLQSVFLVILAHSAQTGTLFFLVKSSPFLPPTPFPLETYTNLIPSSQAPPSLSVSFTFRTSHMMNKSSDNSDSRPRTATSPLLSPFVPYPKQAQQQPARAGKKMRPLCYGKMYNHDDFLNSSHYFRRIFLYVNGRMDVWMDRRTYGRTHPLIEIRGRI